MRLSLKDVRERVRLRALLETKAAEAAASRVTDSDFAELEKRLRVLGEAVASNRYYEAAQADPDFHPRVWQCSGNDMQGSLLEPVCVAVRICTHHA
jgi:DNA-binding GntR family transcriptional regulator